jgi:ribosomal protein S18 acetylase RimI-like enzyme
VAGTPAVYFELTEEPESGVQIAYFGVLPAFLSQGIGGQLLTTAVERAWLRKPSRVWLHTCSLDHPRALANYQARGFQVYKTVEEVEELPERSPGLWQGANRAP